MYRPLPGTGFTNIRSYHGPAIYNYTSLRMKAMKRICNFSGDEDVERWIKKFEQAVRNNGKTKKSICWQCIWRDKRMTLGETKHLQNSQMQGFAKRCF